MLMNGKEVNHLMIGGKSYTADDFLPAIYEFGEKFTNKHYYRALDASGAFSMHYGQVNFNLGIDKYDRQTLVDKIAYYNGEEYALVDCLLQTPGDGEMMYGVAWIKVSEMGGMTRVDATGGVNKPSYLLFIYYCIALLAWGVALAC